MKVRNAGSMQTLDESMESVREFSTYDDLIDYIKTEFDFWRPIKRITCAYYCYDTRIGWDTHLICVDGKAALFADGPMTALP